MVGLGSPVGARENDLERLIRDPRLVENRPQRRTCPLGVTNRAGAPLDAMAGFF